MTTDKATKTWYRVSKYGTEIEEIEVVSQTQKFITIQFSRYDGKSFTRREAISQEYCRSFPFKEQAVSYIREWLNNEIARAKETIAKNEAALATLETENP